MTSPNGTAMMGSSELTPKQLGFRMPAEWQPHQCTWLSWPHNPDTWPRHLPEAQSEFISLVHAIAMDEPVNVAVPDSRQHDLFMDALSQRTKTIFPVAVLQLATNDAWVRDYGPTFVSHKNRLLAIDFKYNAWGGKYPPFEDDQKFVGRLIEVLPEQVTPKTAVQQLQSKLCIEGGAIEVNGNGIALCTKSCALDLARNPDWTLEKIEMELSELLGIDQLIWIQGDALVGDDTDGHIDQLARFTPNNRILYAWTQDKDSPEYAALNDNRDQLQSNLDHRGIPYELIQLPIPQPVMYENKQLPASYCNFYISNGSVLVPQFGDERADETAVQIISESFPGRKMVGLPTYYLSTGLGSFHCLTQQQPAVD